ncbi:MAG: hypothetical protein AAF466_01090 [Bacteroidota bacterium]
MNKQVGKQRPGDDEDQDSCDERRLLNEVHRTYMLKASSSHKFRRPEGVI